MKKLISSALMLISIGHSGLALSNSAPTVVATESHTSGSYVARGCGFADYYADGYIEYYDVYCNSGDRDFDLGELEDQKDGDVESDYVHIAWISMTYPNFELCEIYADPICFDPSSSINPNERLTEVSVSEPDEYGFVVDESENEWVIWKKNTTATD